MSSPIVPWLAVLTGCGWIEDLTDPPAVTVDTLLGPAEEISASELDRLAEEGTVFGVVPHTVEEERADREQRVVAAEEVIDAFLVEHPELEGTLLQQTSASAERIGPNLLHTLPSGREVVLQGEDWDRLTVASVIRHQQDAAHQAEVLADMLPLVPPHCRALAPAADFGTLDAEALVEGRVAVIRCFMDWRGLSFDAGVRPSDVDPGGLPDQWSDLSGECDPAAPDTDGPGGGNDGYAERTPNLPSLQDWPLLNQLPAVRDQVERGTCVAFATASAMEQTFLRRTGAVVDVSEQYLYSVGKWDFDGDHYDDGLNSVDFLEELADRRTPIAVEDGWGYNPSTCRVENEGLEQYRDSCVGYGGDACSETAHQLEVVRSGGELHLFRPGSDETVRIERAIELDLYGRYAETLGHADLYLSAGYGLVASVRWPDNRWGIGADGFATARAEGDEGGHAIHLLGWQRTTDPGGGLVIFKNSWGVDDFGDDGFGYLPLEYFGDALKSLVAIDVVDVANDPPELRILEDGDDFPRGTPFTLHAAITDEAGDDCCAVTWSEGDTRLGVGPTLTLSPDGLGTHRITATARDPLGAFDQYTAEIEVYANQSPRVRIARPRLPVGQDWVTVPRNEWISLSATVSDPNQYIDCADREWRITGEPTRSGCTLNTYLDSGIYTVTHAVTDDAGAEASDSIRLLVKDWTETDPPYLTIRTPRADEILLYDQTIRVEFDSAPLAINGTMHWELIAQNGTATFDDVQTFTFVPRDRLNLLNGINEATLRAELTIDGVTVWDEIPIRIAGPID